MKNQFTSYYSAVRYCESIVKISQGEFKTKSGRKKILKNFACFLKLLGNPHQNLKYIHVAGTSGKGSTAAMIQTILTQAGYKTGLYTSPHPTTSVERIKVNNQLIAPREFAAIIQQLKPVIDQLYLKSQRGRPTYYEIILAAALVYFKNQKCDYVVLEAGIGGKNDITNIIPPPVAAVINLIGFDHTKIIGHTIRQITREKAGIIKPKTLFFTTAKNQPLVLKIFKQVCRKNGAEFNLVTVPKTPYRLSLLGQHQQVNAALAAAVAKKLNIKDTVIQAGLNKVRLSCRLEIIQRKPLVILDGAHNQTKIKTTAETTKNLTYQKLYLIIALTQERNGGRIFKELAKLATEIIVTRYLNGKKKCHPPLALAREIRKLAPKKSLKIFLDPLLALAAARQKARKNDLILVTGSLYLAGELRQYWRPEEKILREREV